MNPKIADLIWYGKVVCYGSNSRRYRDYRWDLWIYGTRICISRAPLCQIDVFSFGVLVLEIVSGKKIGSFRNGDDEENLLSYAWRNWRDGTIPNIIDPGLTTWSTSETFRCIHIGLLCVQENMNNRPTMSSVASMLNNHSFTLSTPSRPAYHSSLSSVPSMLNNHSFRHV
ncbi:putative non-specific serine/threonine protein kinase [Rosa chinensis]|uniref:Putative non-specific serine/threonine protein kinase n=1 Tax=Rosa chinensis TaxID=74649 RepID=A0A2P6QAQ6_ROSCH|nr:putative non-specific serine/threonine protein kinase [Rosa chinensis]